MCSSIVTINVGLLTNQLGYDLNAGFNFKGEGSLPSVIEALGNYSDSFREDRGPEFRMFYHTLRQAIKNNCSPSLIPTIKSIKKKFEGEFFAESDESYRDQLEKKYGLPATEILTKQERYARALEKGGLLTFKKNKLGLNVPLLYLFGTDLSIACVKLRTINISDQKKICQSVKRYQALKQLVAQIAPHISKGLNLGLPTDRKMYQSNYIHPFLSGELQNLSIFPESYQNLLRPFLNYKIEETLPTLIRFINSSENLLQNHSSNSPGFYLEYEEGKLYLTCGAQRKVLTSRYPYVKHEVENAICIHRLIMKKIIDERFGDYPDKVVISLDCGSDGNIIFKYPNFDQQTLTEVLTDVPSKEYVDQKLMGFHRRKFLEDYQKQPDAIPFTIHPLENVPEYRFNQLIVNYKDGYFSLNYLFCTYRKLYFWVHGESPVEMFPKEVRAMHEEMVDNTHILAAKFHQTNAASQSRGVPEMKPGCEPEELLRMFQEINFSDSSEQDYLDPRYLTKEGKTTTVQALAASLIFFVSRLNLDRHIEWDAVPDDPEEQREFKLKLRAYLSHIIFALKTESNLNIRNDMVYQIAESGDLCGRRWQNIVQQIYRQMVLKTVATSDDVEEFLLECADQMKLGILDMMLLKSCNKQNAHERPLFMGILFTNGVSLPGRDAFDSEDPFYRQAYNGAYKNAEDVMMAFIKDYIVSNLYKIIQTNLEQKIRDSQSRFLANLLNVIAQQIIDEMGADPAFIAEDFAYGLRRRNILSEFSEEALAEGIGFLATITDTNKRVRTESLLTETAQQQRKLLEEIEAELKTKLAEISLGGTVKPKTRLQQLKLTAQEEDAKQKAIEEAQANYRAALESLKQELLCQEAHRRQQRKEQLAYQIAKERHYFEYDEDDLPTKMTKAGIRFMLLKFKLIEKNPELMQN